MPQLHRTFRALLIVALPLAIGACDKREPGPEKKPDPTAPGRAAPGQPAAMTATAPPAGDARAPRAGKSWLYPSMEAGPDPSPSLAGPPRPDPDGLEVQQVVMARKLDGRKPDGVTTEFTLEDGVIYCHLEAVNRQGPERKLTVKWFHEGTEFHRVTLTVGKGPIWRTWARHKLRKRHHGSWECTIQNETGVLIGAARFTVKES